MAEPQLGQQLQLQIALVGWLLTLTLAVVGWIASAMIAGRNRKKAFRLDVTEHARREVVPHIVAYQDWISELATSLSGLVWLKQMHESPLFSPEFVRRTAQQRSESLADTLNRSRDALRMFGMLEDYEVVFPQTREVRMDLVGFHSELFRFACEVQSCLITAVPFDYVETGQGLRLDWLDAVDAAQEVYYDMQAMAQDIRTGIQNAALSKVFDASVPEREPREDLPLIVTTGDSWYIRNGLPALPDIKSSSAAAAG